MRYLLLLVVVYFIVGCGSNKKSTKPTDTDEAKTLLWRVSGNGLAKPNYLYGTMHILCANEVYISDSLLTAIKTVDKLYFELDMSDMGAMMKAFPKMMMKGDTTLRTLLNETDYNAVKDYFKKNGQLPFSMVEKMMPLLTSATFAKEYMNCKTDISGTEMRMMELNKVNGKKPIGGLETIEDQIDAFGKISYKAQAEMLIKGMQDTEKSKKMFLQMKKHYLNQDLTMLGKMMKESDEGLMDHEDDLLNNRNRNWIKAFKSIFQQYSIIAAVGAAHLIGENGIIELLRKEGYTVSPVMQ